MNTQVEKPLLIMQMVRGWERDSEKILQQNVATATGGGGNIYIKEAG